MRRLKARFSGYTKGKNDGPGVNTPSAIVGELQGRLGYTPSYKRRSWDDLIHRHASGEVVRRDDLIGQVVPMSEGEKADLREAEYNGRRQEAWRVRQRERREEYDRAQAKWNRLQALHKAAERLSREE